MDLFPLKTTKPTCAKIVTGLAQEKDSISISNGRKIRKSKRSSREGKELGRKAGGRPGGEWHSRGTSPSWALMLLNVPVMSHGEEGGLVLTCVLHSAENTYRVLK